MEYGSAMNKLIVVAALASLSTLAACGCSGFSGGGDRVLSRNSDSIILCENTGFIATTSAGVIEGKYSAESTDADIINAVRGDTNAAAFQLTFDGADQATAMTTNLGDGAWTMNSMNQTELDHANIQCEDLVNRSWWTAQ
jgi:hypothetical protein